MQRASNTAQNADCMRPIFARGLFGRGMQSANHAADRQVTLTPDQLAAIRNWIAQRAPAPESTL